MLKALERRKKRKLQKNLIREEKRRLRQQEEEAARNKWAQIQDAVSGAPDRDRVNGKLRGDRLND